ncbi:MAG: TIGR00725 family protein [Actinobacteria bacterium]|nr:TIGR00725 family protein [Actinomycetota bacterium]
MDLLRRDDDPVYVSVVGGSECDRATRQMAEEVGRLLAQEGAYVVTGGRSGVAEAASRGAFEAGGMTIGILPERHRGEANRWLRVAISTGLGETRNALVVMNGDAVIAFDGAYGTLSEIAHALVHGKRVIGLGAWELRRLGQLDRSIERVATAAEAVELAAAAARQKNS